VKHPPIKAWRRRYYEQKKRHATGWQFSGLVQLLVVHVFVHEGGAGHAPFTSLKTSFNGQFFERRYPKAYAMSWCHRLAGDFECEVFNSQLKVERWLA